MPILSEAALGELLTTVSKQTNDHRHDENRNPCLKPIICLLILRGTISYVADNLHVIELAFEWIWLRLQARR